MTRVPAGLALLFALTGCAMPRSTQPARPQPTATAAEARLVAEVTPVPGLAVRVYAGRVDAGTVCWTFVTAGRARRGQPELVLSIVRRPFDRVRVVPSEAFRLLAEVAADPDVAAWAVLPLAHPALGQTDRVAVVAVPAGAPAGVPLPPGALTLLPATAIEAALVRQFGVTRWLALLGWREGAVAVPWWFDRDHPPVVATEYEVVRTDWRASSAIRVPDLTATMVLTRAPRPFTDLRGTWYVGIPRGRAREFAAALARIPVDGWLEFALTPDPSAEGHLVWVPTHQSELVFTPPPTVGVRIGASLLAVRVEEGRRGALPHEDGVAMFLSPAQRDAAVAALQRGDLPTSGAAQPSMMMPWRFEWR